MHTAHNNRNEAQRRLRRSITAFALLAFAGALAGPDETLAGRKSKKKSGDQPIEMVWPLPPEPPRVKYVREYRGSWDFEQKKKSKLRRLLLGPEKEEQVGLLKPYGVVTDKEGRVYVSDTGLGAVVVFDNVADEVRMLGVTGRVRLGSPLGLAMDSRNRLFVADSKLQQVICLSPEGQPLLALGKKEGMETPSGVALDEERNRLYVTDSHKHQIFVYDLDGRFITTHGARGRLEGEFNFPTNIAAHRDGSLYVVDTANFRVQKLTPEGEFVLEFGEAGNAFGNFTRPKGISIDSEGHLYVVDAAFNNFQIFTDKGELLLFIGDLGRGPGKFYLPAGVHIDPQDRIYIADQANARVQVFQYLSSGQNGDSAAPDKEASSDNSPEPTARGDNEGGEKAE